MWRVAIYARETPGRAGRARLDRQVAALAAQVARQPGWQHVATYGDQDFGVGRPGLSRLLAEAPGASTLLLSTGTAACPRTARSWMRCWPSWAAPGSGWWSCDPRRGGGSPGWWRTWRWPT